MVSKEKEEITFNEKVCPKEFSSMVEKWLAKVE